MIYLQHFGFREPPFGTTPDTAFFFACPSIQEALNTLLVAVSNGEGFIKITGEVGTGKTLLCRKLLSALEGKWATAYIPNPNLEPRTLLLALAEEFGLKVDAHLDQHHLIKALNFALLNFARAKKRALVCLDEAQAMPIESMEALRLLTNLETEKRKLLQVVLFGQPELDERLGQHSIRQLRQRITFQHELRGFTFEETSRYLQHRMKVAGVGGRNLFDAAASRAIHHASAGVPRLINILANKALMLAYGEGKQSVGWHHACAAVEDTPAVRKQVNKMWSFLGLVFVCVVAACWFVFAGMRA
jgi:MSHA biogenesis protein MshM